MAKLSWKRVVGAFFIGALSMVALAAGTLYWQKCFYEDCLKVLPPDSRPTEAVVVFEGGEDRLGKGVEEANSRRAAYFIVSNGRREDIQYGILRAGRLRSASLYLNEKSGTTDADARFAAELLKKFKVQRAILVTSWFHLPRSALLLKLYTVGSGTQILPVASDPAPEKPWNDKVFQIEFVKFWGSLGRAVLHAFHSSSHSTSPTPHG